MSIYAKQTDLYSERFITNPFLLHTMNMYEEFGVNYYRHSLESQQLIASSICIIGILNLLSYLVDYVAFSLDFSQLVETCRYCDSTMTPYIFNVTAQTRSCAKSKVHLRQFGKKTADVNNNALCHRILYQYKLAVCWVSLEYALTSKW